MTRDEIQTWLCHKLATRLQASPEDVDVHRPFDEYGMDTREAEVLTEELEVLLGSRIEVEAFRDHRTVVALSAFLARTACRPLPGGPLTVLTNGAHDELLPERAGKR
jgi:hypothetical protein